MAYRGRPQKFVPGTIVECPACHVRVVVRKDLGCPSCQVIMTAAVDDGQRRLVVSDHQQLPEICASCGEPTPRLEVISAKRGDSDPAARLAPWLALLLSPIAFLWVRGSGGAETIEVAIPRCAACSKQGRLRPEHVNFERGCMTLLVHYRLREAANSR